VPSLSTDAAGHRRIQSLLVVAEAKDLLHFDRRMVQLLAYLGCITRHRQERGTRIDNSSYGLVTDGARWQFVKLESQAGIGQHDTIQVRESPRFKLFGSDGDRRTILTLIIFMIVKGVQLAAAEGSSGIHDDDHRILRMGTMES